MITCDPMKWALMGPINKELRQYVGNSRQLYQKYLEEQKKQKKRTEKDLKRKIVVEEIKDIQKKRRRLTAIIEDLIKDADKYALDAAKRKDFQLLERSNDVRSSVKAKEDDLKELDKNEESLSIRKENI